MKRGDRIRPDDALVVVMLFHGSGRRPPDSDSITSHHRQAFFAVGIEKGGIHALAVLGPQHEDMAHLDAFRGFEHAVFPRRWIAGPGISQICELFHLKIAVNVGI